MAAPASSEVMSMEEAMEAVYTSLANDNEDIDRHISNLKAAMAAAGEKTARVKTARLMHNNRSGRKMMQSYFRQRGVTVEFEEG